MVTQGIIVSSLSVNTDFLMLIRILGSSDLGLNSDLELGLGLSIRFKTIN